MFSVVIPLYNKAKTIERTLKTVLEQTFKDFEVVIVDDGSTDGGATVVERFTNDSRVRLIRQENQGVSIARNQGVSSARYDFIAFLDGDDLWLPEYLARVKEMIDLYPDAGMYCTAGIVRSGGYDHFRIAEKYRDKIVPVNYFQAPFVFSHTSATTVAKKYFNMTRGFPPHVKNFQDFYLFTSVALISQVIYYGKPLTFYIGGVEGQATSTVSFTSKLDFRARYMNEFTHEYLRKKNKALITWLRAFSRNEIWFMLKDGRFENITCYISKMDPVTRKECLGIGRKIYTKKKLKIISLIYAVFRKSLFALRGYPTLKLNKGKIKTPATAELNIIT